MKKAWWLSFFWIGLALAFNGLIYAMQGKTLALQFFTAYLVEKSLSIDNLFVFFMLFSEWSIAFQQQRKVLFWGILGAVVFRLIFIVLGIELLRNFFWMTYILGAFLCFTGIRLWGRHPQKMDIEQSALNRFFSFLPVAKDKAACHFFVREEGRFKVTQLFLALLIIESVDILFALDSIPAVLAITTDPFIAYTSNIFAILGLRSLYLVLSPLLKKCCYLHFGLSVILVFVGIKMLLAHVLPIPLFLSLCIILAILVMTVLLSYLRSRK